jgi:3-oxoacyl-[acyl-carrier-protein] synthase-1/3-oxoacyl-[acyl-carrier-protein] synthase II
MRVTAVEVVAFGAVSALGSGRGAFSVGNPGDVPPCAIREDARLVALGLKRPWVARVEPALTAEADAGAALLERAAVELRTELDRRAPAWRRWRVGVTVGTSAGGFSSLERALAERAAGRGISRARARASAYFGPLAALGEFATVAESAPVQVLAACASSTVALGLAYHWLAAGHCELVIAGGYDAVSDLVAAGFESLNATTASRPAPFRAARDGLALGEGAALLALALPGRAPPLFEARIVGFGVTTDAVHITAPDRTGDGLARAAEAALLDGSVSGGEVGLVSAHGTATPFNDAAESHALSRVVTASRERPVIHAFKASIGHTLGAAGALETLALLDALEREILPGTAGAGSVDPALEVRVPAHNSRGTARAALKLSAAFGGVNAALALARGEPAIRPAPARVRIAAVGQPLLEPAGEPERTQLAPGVFDRLDRLSQLTVSGAARVRASVSDLDPARIGVVLGTTAATIENNEAADARRRRDGPKHVEPRRFPGTSPNVPAGWAAIAFGWRGPAFAVGGGHAAAFEALLVAFDLTAAGDAEAIVVVAAEDAGDTVRALWQAAGWRAPPTGAAALVVRRLAPGETSGAELRRADLLELRRRGSEEPSHLGAESSAFEPVVSGGWPALLVCDHTGLPEGPSVF